MRTAITILKNIVLPKLEKDSGFDITKINATFWEKFSKAILDFETNAKPVYLIINSIDLADAEKVIKKIEVVYSKYISELAEQYVLKQTSEAIDYLVQTKNETFLKEVDFLQTMQKAIKSVERKRIKADLPNSYDRLTFELSENDLASVTKKKGREDLKAKFKQWDAEMREEEVPVLSIDDSKHKKKPRVIQLSWIKYAAAACLVLGLGIWFYENQTQDLIPSTTIVTAPDKKKPSSKPEVLPIVPTEALAEVSTVSKSLEVKEGGLGFASKTKKISVVENNQKERILSIGVAIEKYQMQLEKEFVTQKGGNRLNEKTLRDTIISLKKELKKLKERDNRYNFDGKTIIIYISTTPKIKDVIIFEDQYYLYKEKSFYRLSVSNQPQLFQKETDSIILRELDIIINQ